MQLSLQRKTRLKHFKIQRRAPTGALLPPPLHRRAHPLIVRSRCINRASLLDRFRQDRLLELRYSQHLRGSPAPTANWIIGNTPRARLSNPLGTLDEPMHQLSRRPSATHRPVRGVTIQRGFHFAVGLVIGSILPLAQSVSPRCAHFFHAVYRELGPK